MKTILTLIAVLSMRLVSTYAQTKPVFTQYDFESSGIIQGMSDNGKWAMMSSNSEGVCQSRLINLDTQEYTVINSESKTEYGADVSNDGNTVVGSVNSLPAYYSKATEKWTTLPTKTSYVYGCAYSVSADGRYAVGELWQEDIMMRVPAMWDLTTGKFVQTPNLPTKDMSQTDQGMMKFMKISSDNRYILGCMSYSYIPSGEDPGGCFFFVYDRDNSTYKPIGFTETDKGSWTPKADGLLAIMEASMSNNGRYVTGSAYFTYEVEGEYYRDEYEVPFLYDVEADNFTAYNETAVQSSYGTAVSNDGIVLDASPVSTPVREWYVRSDKYWFGFSEILKQKYSTTFAAETSLSNTGTVNGVSDDGKRIVAFPDPYSSYVVDLPVPISELGEGMKLLGSYSPSPAEGAVVSHLKNITVTFDRNIKAVGKSSTAQILTEDGTKVYSSVAFSAEGKELSIRFRTGTLSEGKNYRLYIPAGSVAVADDETQTNMDIYISYTGRADQPLQVTNIYPENGTAFSHIDYSTSPVILTFDTDIAITDSATAVIYRNDEAEPFCSLTLARSGSKLALYPSSLQYLYNGSTYRVVVNQGAVTDVAGNNPNETISVNYLGNYERQIDPSDVILFSDNFDNGLGNFMQWCGDQNTPTSEMQNWDFTKGMAWGLVRESESSSDRMAASHSMYSPSGQSDDWLVIPQLYIPDMLCNLRFLSQSYKKSKTDVLKVIAWESNNVYNTLTDDIIAKIKAEGKVIYDKVQSPGENEESLAGEWESNRISLVDFAGKNIYLCFVNENDDQSAIFMDSLQVRHDMNFLLTVNYEESVINQSNTPISGVLMGNGDVIYNNVSMQLTDQDGNVIDTYSASNINLGKGDQHKFAFQKPLPLSIGKENTFYVKVNMDGEENSVKGTVKDLVFQPVKRMVLEEYTGRACGNCPLGILAIDKIKARYGDCLIPVSIHTYNNDPLSSGLSNYTSSLGIDELGAPSGLINRGTGCYPAVSATVGDDTRYFFTNADPDLPGETDKLWMDYAIEEMATPAECNIDIARVTYDESTMTFSAQCDVRFALNAENQTINLFTVLLEDSLYQYQSNYFAAISSPDLGEWGQGGIYAQSKVQNYCNMDVCRNVNGTTIFGTGGYIPSSVVAGETYTANLTIQNPYTSAVPEHCKVVVMMIDANTGSVINAALGKYSSETGIDMVRSSNNNAPKFSKILQNGKIVIVNGDRTYNIQGQRIK